VSVRRCLDKETSRRFQSAQELAAGIESISDVRSGSITVPENQTLTSIAVLPFSNLSADPDNQYFSDGLAEELINALTRLSGLRVASRTSAFRFGGRDADVRHIGRELGVGAILEGSVRRAGSRLRITAQLTNTEDGVLRSLPRDRIRLRGCPAAARPRARARSAFFGRPLPRGVGGVCDG
jgi:TolB-like protein